MPVPCPDCGITRLLSVYRADPATRCHVCNGRALGRSRAGIVQRPEIVARRIATAHANGSIDRNIARLAERNRGSRIGAAHRARIIESNRTRIVTPESRGRRSAATRRLWAEGKASSRVGTGRRGKRADLGNVAFRSTWEANVARVLNACGVGWQFEPERFALSSGSTYAPDFRLANGIYIEVKGYWRKEARERFETFRREYPVTVHVIDERVYRSMEARWSRLIPTWERARKD
jgi:hypothetical protein